MKKIFLHVLTSIFIQYCPIEDIHVLVIITCLVGYYSVHSGYYTVGITQWVLHSGYYTVDITQWVLHSGYYTVGITVYIVGITQWVLQLVYITVFGKIYSR